MPLQSHKKILQYAIYFKGFRTSDLFHVLTCKVQRKSLQSGTKLTEFQVNPNLNLIYVVSPVILPQYKQLFTPIIINYRQLFTRLIHNMSHR